MTDISEILEQIFNEIDTSIEIYFVTEGENGEFILRVNRTLWVREGEHLTFQDNLYTVFDVVRNLTITVKPASSIVTPQAGVIELATPFFQCGKYDQVVDILREVEGKTPNPLIWLVDPTDRQFITDINSSIESKGAVRLFFLTNSNFSDYDNKKDRLRCIYPMQDLLEMMIEKSRSNHLVGRVTVDGRMITHSRVTANINQNIFGNPYSGIEVFVDFPIRKNNCKTPQRAFPPTPPAITQVLTIEGLVLTIDEFILILEP